MIFENALLDAADLEAIAATLEASGDYRVLRRLTPRASTVPPAGLVTRIIRTPGVSMPSSNHLSRSEFQWAANAALSRTSSALPLTEM